MSADETQLDDVLRLTTQRFLERRLQTRVFKMNYAKSVHHARTLIYQRHIRVGKQLVNQANFLVRGDSESHIDFALASPYNTATGTPGRVGEFAGGLFGMGFIARLLPPATLALFLSHALHLLQRARRRRRRLRGPRTRSETLC